MCVVCGILHKSIFFDCMYNVTIEEVFDAYFECRKTKRYSSGALTFESNYEENLIRLYDELKSGSWVPGRSTCFIVTKPVKREIFAAPFRDRIVHHILINRLNAALEKHFIFDSYACRVGKGTHAAIKRVEHFIRQQTENGTKTAYVLKLDIKGFFMSIDRSLLYTRLCDFIDKNYRPADAADARFEKYLAHKIIFNDPCKNAIIQSPKSSWSGLPKDKSLFTAKKNCGLPIGNLTSQVFANFYLSSLDHFVKHRLGVRCYVRYVDDMVIVHRSKEFLKKVVPQIRWFLQADLKVCLHPKKIYLQPAANCVAFLGTTIHPHFTQCSKRIKNNFASRLKSLSALADEHKPDREEKDAFMQSVNSYLGIMAHYKTYRFRRAQLKRYLNPYWIRYFSVCADCKKVVRKASNVKAVGCQRDWTSQVSSTGMPVA